MADRDRPLASTKIADFGGLKSNRDPHDLKPGETVDQVNCAGSTPGVLKTRSGLRFVDFADGNGGTTNDVQAVYPFQTPKGDYLVYQRTDGTILAGRDPA